VRVPQIAVGAVAVIVAATSFAIAPSRGGTTFISVATVHARMPTDIAWSPQGDKLALIGSSGLVVFDPTSHTPASVIPMAGMSRISWRQDGQLLAVRTQTQAQRKTGIASLVFADPAREQSSIAITDTDIGEIRFDSGNHVHVWARDSQDERTVAPRVGPAVGRSSVSPRPSLVNLKDKEHPLGLLATFHPAAAVGGATAQRGKFNGRQERAFYLDSFPDGETFLIAREGAKEWHTLIVGVDGTVVRDLGPRVPGRFMGNSVSADGLTVLGVIDGADEDENGVQPLATLDLKSGEMTVIEGVRTAFYPQFSRDGRYVAYWDASKNVTTVGTLSHD